jgi:glyceraldehyde-3-phosphate dehydrogenase (NADP+)
MSMGQDIQSVFPEEREIPERVLARIPVHADAYLINGEIRHWGGPMQEVYSPVCVRASSKALPKRVGSYPLLTEKEAVEALGAAVQAYDNGRGLWPTMPVAERIAHIEDFTHRMIENKDDIVNLLMWEVGKPYADSEKEFNRTVQYIKDTMGALKDLDRVSSRFVMEQGIMGQIRRAPLGVALCMGPFNYPLNRLRERIPRCLRRGKRPYIK